MEKEVRTGILICVWVRFTNFFLLFTCSDDNSQKAADARRRWAEDFTKTSLCNLDGWWEPHAEFDEEHLIGNIENAIGVIRISVGVVGPVKINGNWS